MYDKAHINVYKSSNLRFEYHQTFLVGCSLVPCYDLGNLNNVNAKIIELLQVGIHLFITHHIVVLSHFLVVVNPQEIFGFLSNVMNVVDRQSSSKRMHLLWSIESICIHHKKKTCILLVNGGHKHISKGLSHQRTYPLTTQSLEMRYICLVNLYLNNKAIERSRYTPHSYDGEEIIVSYVSLIGSCLSSFTFVLVTM